MMLRKFAVSLAVAGIISASNANALGLGEIKIHSALNEPLNAEIKLLQVRKLGPLQIQPRMADIDEFALAGLDKSRFLTDVSFQVKVNPDGSGLITMRSDRAVREPFLNFLVEVNWPNGRLVREYTLLLDPPVFDPTPVRKTVQPSTTAVKPPANLSSKTISHNRSNVSGKTEVYVDAKDTLWSIAIKHRPNSSISAKKMMIALQKKNPDAFVNNNINALRAGSRLALPTLAEINSLNSQDAALEVVRQTSEWKNASAPSSTPAAEMSEKEKEPQAEKPKDSSASAVPEKPTPEPEDDKSAELKIVTPKDTLEPEEGVMTDQSEADKDAEAPSAEQDEETKALNERNLELEARLSESLESVDKISRENVELNERLDSIQYELEKLREMLELKDNQLSALQNKVQEAEAKPEPKPEKGLLDKLLGSPLTLGGIGAALIALLAGLFFFMRKGKGKDEEQGAEDAAALVQVPEELTAEPEETIESEEAVEEKEDAAEEVADDLDIGDEGDLLEDTDLDLSDTDELDDLDDLDLDMDMDLDLEEDSLKDDILQPVEAVEEPDELDKLLDDDEFDLGLDDDEEESELDSILAADENDASAELESAESEVAELEESDALDDILGEVDNDSSVEFEVDDIDLDLDAENDTEIDLGLEDDLDFEVAGTSEVEELVEVDASEAENDEDGLDFVVSPSEDLSGAEVENTSEMSESEDLDETGLDALLDSVSDDEIGELTQAAEQAGELDDLDSILGEESNDEPSVDEHEDTNELDSILGELDEVEAELGSEDAEIEADADTEERSDTDDVTDADLEAMLAANADPDDVPLDGILEAEGEAGLDVGSDDLDDLLASMDEPAEAEEAESDDATDDLDAMLDDIDLEDIDLGEVDETDPTTDDLDALLSDLDEGDVAAAAGVAAGAGLAATALSDSDEDLVVEDDDLESDIAQDLEADLDSELDALLSSSDDIELEELTAEEEDVSEDEDFDELAGLNLLEGADEVETKLDLARAYLDMEDLDGAKDILEEIVSEGSEKQKTEAEALIQSINEK